MPIRILAVSSEAYPLAKSGGLGDAVSGLARALHRLGTDIALLLPAYEETLAQLDGPVRIAVLEGLPGGPAQLLRARCPSLGLPVFLLRNDALYHRTGLYVDEAGREYPDNPQRFAALAQAAVRIAAGMPGVARPHILHAHDWHTGLIPLYLHQDRIADVKTMLTLHNIAFQGLCPMENASELGISPEHCRPAGSAEFWGQLSFLKAGIRHADIVSVVSRNYAREILTPEGGCGLDHDLRARGKDLISIPNGIDTAFWNPADDPYLSEAPYDVTRLSNKQYWKSVLQKHYGLREDPSSTILASGSRLTTQKMADVACLAIPELLERHPGLQVCILGQGDKRLEADLSALSHAYPGRCAVHIGYSEREAHWLHAGADVLLHGSRFEPFGLTPLYAMRYGTIPVCSRVGGMVDTIVDPGPQAAIASMHSATGLLFDGDRPQDMVRAVARVLHLRALPEVWQAMQSRAMMADFSWGQTAPAYQRAYHALRPDVAAAPDPLAVLPGLHRRKDVLRATTLAPLAEPPAA